MATKHHIGSQAADSPAGITDDDDCNFTKAAALVSGFSVESGESAVQLVARSATGTGVSPESSLQRGAAEVAFMASWREVMS